MNENNKYPIAQASKRILSRCLDFLLCFIVIISLDIGVVFAGEKNIYNGLEYTWKYSIMGLMLIFIHFLYFIIIPLVNKKGTLFNIALKINIFNEKKNYFLNLIKKELFLFLAFDFIVLCISIIVSFLDGDMGIKFINEIMNFSFFNKFDNFSIYASIFNLLLVFCCCFIFYILVNTIFCSRRHTWLDYFSNMTMYNIKSYNIKIKKNVTKNHNLPGQISIEDLKELKKI